MWVVSDARLSVDGAAITGLPFLPTGRSAWISELWAEMAHNIELLKLALISYSLATHRLASNTQLSEDIRPDYLLWVLLREPGHACHQVLTEIGSYVDNNLASECSDGPQLPRHSRVGSVVPHMTTSKPASSIQGFPFRQTQYR